jgi:hypothetical protein
MLMSIPVQIPIPFRLTHNIDYTNYNPQHMSHVHLIRNGVSRDDGISLQGKKARYSPIMLFASI